MFALAYSFKCAIHDVYSIFNQMQGQQPGHDDVFGAFHLSEYFLLCLFSR